MTNPFENPNANYNVLINNEGQYSLWPSFVEVPNGWNVVVNNNNREDCLNYINNNWTDMRPNSLANAMAGASA